MEKVVLFLTGILVFCLVAVVVIDPSGSERSQGGEAPLFEFRSYAYYDITKNGVDEYLLSDEGYHYPRLDLLTGVRYFIKTQGGVDELESATAYIYPQYSDFNGSVIYHQADGHKLLSKDVRYNKKTSQIVGHNPFVIKGVEGRFEGASFWIDTKERVMKASHIAATLLIEE